MAASRRRGVLLLLGSLILAAAAARDVVLGFTLLHPGTLVLLLLVSLAIAVRAATHLAGPSGRGKARFIATLVVALTTIALSANSLFYRTMNAGLPESWRVGEEARLSKRADLLEAEFADLIARAEEPVRRAREIASRQPKSGAPEDMDRAFEMIRLLTAGRPSADARLATTIFGPGRRALAWTGPSSQIPPELLVLSIPEGSTKWLAVDIDGLTRLVALARPWKGSPALLVVETAIRSIYDDRVLAAALPPPGFVPEGDRISFTSYRQSPLPLQDLFNREGDRLSALGTAKPTMHLALRSPDRALLGYATLSGRSFDASSQDLFTRRGETANQIVVAACILLLGMGILPRTGEPSGYAREMALQAARIAGVWGLRGILLVFPIPMTIGGQSLDDPALFASRAFAGLFGSPQDFFLTAMAILATGIVVSLATSRILLSAAEGGRRRGAGVCLALFLATAFLLGVLVPSHVSIFVKNSRVDILTAAPLDPSAPRLTMQVSAVFSLLGLILPMLTFAWGAVWAAPRGLARGAPPPPLPTEETLRWIALLLVPSALGACVLLELTLQPAATAALREFVEGNLAGIVKRAPIERRLDLRDAIRAVASYPAIADRVASTDPAGDPTLAYDLWLTTPLASKRYSASLLVIDPSGRLLSRFSRNFPPILDAATQEPEDPNEEQILSFVTGPRGREVRALHEHTVLRRNGEIVGTITIHLRDDFGNLPPLTPPTPLEEAMGEESQVSYLLPPWARSIGLSVYDSQGMPLAANPRDLPIPAEQRTTILSDFREQVWVVRMQGGVRTHELFFSSADHLVALSFPEPGWIVRTARTTKLFIQGVLCLLLLMTPWWIASAFRLGWRLNPFRLFEALTLTHYRRLVAAFLTATVAPLTVLAVALTEYMTSEIELDVRERGWTLFRAARDQVEDFGVLQGPEGFLDDAYLFNLTETIGEEAALYTGGVLRAASDREIFDIGAAPTRIDGGVYRAIEIEGKRVVVGNTEIGGRPYKTINGVVSLGLAGEGVLSILLSSQPAEVERRAQEVYDALLLTTASVILFMSVLAYVLARRIASPIRRLSAATSRIAAGDLNTEVEASARDETGDLVASFNAMARALRRQRDDLQQRGNYIEKILLNATTGVLSVDFRGRVVTINPAAIAILGIRDLGPGMDLPARLSESKDFAPLRRALQACLESPTQPREVQAEIGPAGESRYALARILPFVEGSGFLIFLDDVTETVRSNRLAAWAEMARRIAHEIKNPLTPIQLSADHLRRVFADGSPNFPSVLEECLHTIHEQVTTLRGIAAEFGDYARVPEIRKETTGIAGFLDGVVRPYRTSPPESVAVECDLDGDLGTMDLDRTMITQAIVNLIENALQAMPEGGRLMIRAEKAGAAETRSLQISISDTGVGMDREALSRAFEPYFSTKGGGTGLGMAIAKRAIEEHNGRIELTSAPMKGTTARIILPSG